MEQVKEVVERLMTKGLIGFREVPAASTPQKRAADRERIRARKGYKPWKPGGSGRPPILWCRRCGSRGNKHGKNCPLRLS